MFEKEYLKEFVKFLEGMKVIDLDDGKNTIELFIEQSKEGLENIKTNLQLLPGKIRDKELSVARSSKDVEELNLINKNFESTIYGIVSKETDVDKRLMYSNDTKRKSETERRLKDNRAYTENTDRLKELKTEIKEEEITLGFLKRCFRSAEAQTRIGD